MIPKPPQPGIRRADSDAAEGLRRLQDHLQNGAAISDQVLVQWIRRYGDPARCLIKRYGRYRAQLDSSE